MLDFMKVKLALFDFDDTLCIHTVRPQVRDEVAYDVDIMCGKDPWPDGIVPQSMGGICPHAGCPQYPHGPHLRHKRIRPHEGKTGMG